VDRGEENQGSLHFSWCNRMIARRPKIGGEGSVENGERGEEGLPEGGGVCAGGLPEAIIMPAGGGGRFGALRRSGVSRRPVVHFRMRLNANRRGQRHGQNHGPRREP
jgi:hypothetical protein